MQPTKTGSIARLAVMAALALLLPAQVKAPRQPIARIGEQTIYEDDLQPSIGGQLWQLRNQEYELKSKALDDVINQRVLEAAAKARGISVESLVEGAIERDPPPVSLSEVEAYYLAQKDRINRPFSEVKPQLEQALLQARRQQARQAYIDELRKKADIAISLPRPRIEVTIDPSRLRGNPDAPVTIIEFSDFECPYCRSAQPIIKQILDKYKDKVRLGYRDFPLRQIHPQAQQAAEASRCAAEQEKFWEYHDFLYNSQAKLDLPGLTEHAQKAGLDVNRFSDCLKSGKFKSLVDSDAQTGMMSGVSGTPAFYINGVLLTGAQPASAFEKIIDSELAAAQSKKTQQ